MGVEHKVSVAGDCERVNGKCVEHLGRFNLAWWRTSRTKLGKTVRDVKDENDEEAVGGALDLKVTEERVGTEEVEGFVNYVRLVWVRCLCKWQVRSTAVIN
jgi:hypothetical protein